MEVVRYAIGKGGCRVVDVFLPDPPVTKEDLDHYYRHNRLDVRPALLIPIPCWLYNAWFKLKDPHGKDRC